MYGWDTAPQGKASTGHSFQQYLFMIENAQKIEHLSYAIWLEHDQQLKTFCLQEERGIVDKDTFGLR